MKICIVIPVINEASQIGPAIERAWESNADEVVVVDGGSTDATVESAQKLNCQLIRSASGRAVQMNAGAKATQAEVIVFLHVDNWLARNACQQIRLELADPAISFGGFQQQIENSKRIFRWIESGNRWRAKQQGLIYGDQAFFIRRSLFEELKGFPELPLMEDFEFSRRLKSFGRSVILPGPTYVSARRWEKTGPLRQTLRNWFLSFAYRMGASPEWLAKQYRRHDQ